MGVHEEMDVRGGTPLAQREGARTAVETIEAGHADDLVAAYFDRLFRSLRVQDEIVSRVEAAGGRVLTVDFGRVSAGTAAQWLSGTMVGAVSEYHARHTAERTAEARALAIARGVPAWPGSPPGYVRSPSGQLAPDPMTAPVVAEAFAMRAEGATVSAVLEHLRANGIDRSFGAVTHMLRSRVYLGEIFHGPYKNPAAHPPIVDAATFERVRRARAIRGRKAKSERLLARLGILRCGGCGRRMTVGNSGVASGGMYRCSIPSGPCDARASITCTIADAAVIAAVRTAIADIEGRASAETNVRDAEHDLERAQADLDAATRVTLAAGIMDEPSAVERLAELRRARDDARDRLDQLGGQRATVVIRGDRDWDLLTIDERRQLILAVVDRATVRPGRGRDRVTVTLVGQ